MATPGEETGPEVAATAAAEEVVTMTGLVGGVGREEGQLQFGPQLEPSFQRRKGSRQVN